MQTLPSVPMFLLVALGGAMGAVARFVISGRIQLRLAGSFPWGVLAVNVLGCLLAGLATGWLLQERIAVAAALVLPGFLGAFTTFSSFAADVVNLEAAGARGRALVYVVASVTAGLAAAAVGLGVGRSLVGM